MGRTPLLRKPDMRSLDQIYWDSHCDSDCGCRSLQEALERHPELRTARDGEPAPDKGQADE
jgi:hypothetical protein